MIALTKEECQLVFENGHFLLEGWEEDVTMMSCIEGNMGQIWVNDRENIYIIVGVVGDFAFLLGKDRIEDEEENDLINFLKINFQDKIMITQIERWKDLIERLAKELPKQFEMFTRYSMKGEKNLFNTDALRRNLTLLPERFTIHRVDQELFEATLLEEWSKDFCNNFSSYEQFKAHGIGYVICYQGEMVAGASTYSYCKGKIEIEIVTKEEFRRRGFGLICGSAVILEALERDLYPRWDAANLGSVALAEKLGYTFDQEYNVFHIY